MDKEKYYKRSLAQGLPNVCPIVNYCKRRAWTIYFFSDYKDIDHYDNMVTALNKEGVLPEDFEEKCIELQGEEPIFSKSPKQDSVSFYNMCPEVNLLDQWNSIQFAKGIACSSAIYDKEDHPNGKILETKHYSECSEFSKYLFDTKNITLKKTTTKKHIGCYLYVMLDNSTGFYKIGISVTPKHRERTLQSEKPTIDMLFNKHLPTRKEAKKLETFLHKEYQDKNTRGEWFALDESDLKEIKKIINDSQQSL